MERGIVRQIVTEGKYGFFTDERGKDVHFRLDGGEQREALRSQKNKCFFLGNPVTEPVAEGDKILFLREPRPSKPADHAYLWGKAPQVIKASEAVKLLKISTAA